MRKALYTALATIPEFDNNVFPLTLPQDFKKRCAVYKIIGNRDTTGVSCTDPIDTVYAVQIDVLSKQYGESSELAEKVRQVLRDTFIVGNGMSTYEDYLNLTLKYRNIIDCQLRLK